MTTNRLFLTIIYSLFPLFFYSQNENLDRNSIHKFKNDNEHKEAPTVNVIPAPFKSTVKNSENVEFIIIDNQTAIHSPKEMESIIDAYIKDLSADGLPTLAKSHKGIIKIKIDHHSRKQQNEVPAALGRTPQQSMLDERYNLSIDKNGVLITAQTAIGAYRGLTTLRQLLMTSEKSNDGKIILKAMNILDGPKISWRGFKLDVARNYVPVATIKEIIDQLSLYKYNILTLHLTDNEAWRITIKKYPELTSFTKDYYSQEELTSITEYAKNHGLVVIPEIDFPGHSAALLKVYPELGTLKMIAGKNVAYIDPSSDKFWEIFEDTAKELTRMTNSNYLHFGGDEAFGMSDTHYHQFITGALKRIHQLGITPIGYQESTRAGVSSGDYVQIWADFADPGGDLEKWEQMVKEGKPLPEGLPAEALPFYRKAGTDLGNALKQDAIIIASPTKRAYFDTPYAESSSDAVQEKNRKSLGLKLYTPQTLEQFYSWTPATILYGLPLAKLGGVEAAVWSDTITDMNTLWSLILSRLPGFAEKSWSFQDNLTWENYRQRLSYQSINWKARNLTWFQSSLIDWK